MRAIRILSVVLTFCSYTASAQTAEDHFKSAETQYNLANYKEAITLYTKAIEVDPKYENAYLRRAFCYSVNQQYAEAIKDFDFILSHDPKQMWALTSRGSAYNKLNKFNEAMSDFNKVLGIDPENQEAYNNRGWAKEGLGDHAGACADWKKSKKLGNHEAKIILENTKCK